MSLQKSVIVIQFLISVISLIVILDFVSKHAKTRYDSKKKMKEMGISHDLNLSSKEQEMLLNVVMPEDITTTMDDIGGMNDTKKRIYREVIIPMTELKNYKSGNMSKAEYNERGAIIDLPKGMLFYGPPGTGKTMTARAVAKRCNCAFININSSSIMDKWLGESEKNLSALFSLAQKLSPCIIFIDEIDMLVGTRSGISAGAGIDKKIVSEFLSHWDGFHKKHENEVIVFGTTNRPQDIDPAGQRRFTLQIEFKPPTYEERIAIFTKLRTASKQQFSNDINFELLSQLTNKYVQSELQQIFTLSVKRPIYEMYDGRGNRLPGKIRPVNMDDFELTIQENPPYHELSTNFASQDQTFRRQTLDISSILGGLR